MRNTKLYILLTVVLMSVMGTILSFCGLGTAIAAFLQEDETSKIAFHLSEVECASAEDSIELLSQCRMARPGTASRLSRKLSIPSRRTDIQTYGLHLQAHSIWHKKSSRSFLPCLFKTSPSICRNYLHHFHVLLI